MAVRRKKHVKFSSFPLFITEHVETYEGTLWLNHKGGKRKDQKAGVESFSDTIKIKSFVYESIYFYPAKQVWTVGGLGTRTCTHVLNKGNQSHLEKGNQEAKWNTSMMKLFHLQRLSRNKNLFFLTRNKVFPSYPAAIHFLEQAPPQPYSLWQRTSTEIQATTKTQNKSSTTEMYETQVFGRELHHHPRQQPWTSTMDSAGPFRHQDKTSGTRGRIKAENPIRNWPPQGATVSSRNIKREEKKSRGETHHNPIR